MTLRVKFSVAAAGLVLVVVGSLAAVLFIFERRHLLDEQQQGLRTQVNGLAEVARESVVTKNDISLLNYLGVVRTSRAVTYGLFLDEAGEVRAHTDPQHLGTRLTDDASQWALGLGEPAWRRYEHPQRGRVLEWAAPVRVGDRTSGAVRIGYSAGELEQVVAEALRSTARRIFGVATVTLAAGIVMALAFAGLLTRPIRVLAEGARRIGSGHLDHRIAVRSTDELGALAGGFNDMAVKLQELDQLKDDFVSSVSHELRSPLTAIKGYVDFIAQGKAGPLTEPQREQLAIVTNNTARLTRFINDILDVAKIEAGRVDLRREAVPVTPLLEEIVTLFRPVAEERRVRLLVSAGDGLPPVSADQDKVRQVVTNLVSNALKFTPADGRIIVSAVPADGGVRVSVADTGIGIPPDQLHKVFDKFHQVSGLRDQAKGPKGTGLGLTISKGIVELHGGRIWVESVPNQGATFHFTLPAART